MRPSGRYVGILGAWVAFAVLAIPGTVRGESPDKYVELLRSDVRATKVELLTEGLDLSQAEADAFWPIQREYETELAKLGDRRLALIDRYAESYGRTTAEEAKSMASEWFSLQSDRLKLRKKYFRKISKATSERVAFRFTQVENLVGMLIDLQIAAELPLIE